jgi:hypothetical protein
VQTVLVEKQALTIPIVQVTGITAAKVVEKAIAEIPKNYASTAILLTRSLDSTIKRMAGL